jgi:hypothetical protein
LATLDVVCCNDPGGIAVKIDCENVAELANRFITWGQEESVGVPNNHQFPFGATDCNVREPVTLVLVIKPANFVVSRVD